MDKLRVLVVDDTIIYRKIVGDVISAIPGAEVVGTANNGKIALSKITTLKPDLVTLDIEMPEMNGLEALEHLHRTNPEIGVVMLSTLTQEGSDMTVKALELGAFDFIPKPQSGSMTENLGKIRGLLTPIVEAFRRRLKIKGILAGKKAPRRPLPRPAVPKPAVPKPAVPRPSAVRPGGAIPRSGIKGRSEIITIGISTGGPNALAKMMPLIPADIGVPILIVQHMPPIFTESLAKSLNNKCAVTVREAKDGEVIEAGTALIAPGGKQMKIIAATDGRNRIVRITDDPPENSCKPSADYLFRSIASLYIGRATGVIMTGMGSDGTKGLKQMKANGSFIIAQNEETCTVFGMPKEPIESNIVDVVAPLERIASEITKTVKQGQRATG